MALVSLNIGEDDEVIIQSNSCPALSNTVLLQNAKPVIVDIEENSFNISLEEIKNNISPKTKAIIVPHIFGFPARIDEIVKLGIPVIEDCAQSIGGTYKGKNLGTFSDFSMFSFYASKVITAGDAGIIATNDETAYQAMINVRYYGHKRNHKITTFNYHTTNINAALALSQLNQLHGFVEKRKRIANLYDSLFADNKKIKIVFFNKEEAMYYRYPIQVNSPANLKEKLKSKGVFTGFGVSEGLHRLYNLRAFNNTDFRL